MATTSVLRALAGLAAGLLALLLPPPAAGQDEEEDVVPFISVTPDPDYERADATLAGYLSKEAGLTFSRPRPATYHNAIEEAVRHSDTGSPYVARLTPYACVVAELQGAKFEILATYLSRATEALTYNSYFVVKAQYPDFAFSAEPNLRDLAQFLAKSPRVFSFHDKFSTSSYFIPLHFFRTQGIYHLEPGQNSGRLIPLEVGEVKAGKGSSDLVRAVAGTPDIAVGRPPDIVAVWDGTKKKFANDPAAAALRFIRLDTVLPNDLLVASTALSPQRIAKLRQAVRRMPCDRLAFAGDFECWTDIDDAPEAREALAALRRLASAQPAPVTVRIRLVARGGEAAAKRHAPYLEAARQAVRLAGTELVLFDPDYHRWADLDWKLELIHDGALKLTSIVNGVDQKKVEPQTFRISFADAQEELTRRIVTTIHTRLHRIRYLWPFETRLPTVLRDVGFALPPGSRITVQKITWSDPERNEFSRGDDFQADVTLADFHKFQLDDKPFPKRESQDLDIDPMSNSAFRVILVRPTTEKPLFRWLTVALVALFVLGGAASAVDLYRARGTSP